MTESRNLPFQYEEKEVMTELLEEVNIALKDSDAVQEKEMVKSFLRSVSDTMNFIALGNEEVGKTSFLNALFGGALCQEDRIHKTNGICEYRYGEEEAEFRISSSEIRCFKKEDALWGLSVVDTEGLKQIHQKGLTKTLRTYLEKSDVIFAVFLADSVNNPLLWDIIEGIDSKKIVFVLTKCDCVGQAEREKSEIRLKRYMEEAGIFAPLFWISSIKEKNMQNGFDELCLYVERNIIGKNPILAKQQDNLLKLKGMLNELSASFDLRKKQYEADVQVLERINEAVDLFCIGSKEKIEYLKEELSSRIAEELEAYQTEVVAKLDPKKIKERFPKGSDDFVDYMNLINESYRKKMTDQVNYKTQQAVKTYLSELEDVFDKATGYFRKRESLLKLEDKFYGTLAENKNTMVKSAARSLDTAKEYYHSLADASGELFMKLWKARESYDKKQKVTKAAGFSAGAAGSGGTALAVAHAVAVASEAATAFTAGGLIISGLVAVVGGIVVMEMAKKIFSAKNMEDLEKKTQECIFDFKAEVLKIRKEMTGQILTAVEELFQRELANLDQTFVDFRMSVNIDSKNIPLLEERLKTVSQLMDKVKLLERSI